MASLREAVVQHDVHLWVRTFLDGVERWEAQAAARHRAVAR